MDTASRLPSLNSFEKFLRMLPQVSLRLVSSLV
jgi:hypothetical protein